MEVEEALYGIVYSVVRGRWAHMEKKKRKKIEREKPKNEEREWGVVREKAGRGL